MEEEDIIILGDKVELVLEDNKIYKTKIEDLTDTGLYLVAVPSLGGVPAPLYLDDRISVGFYRESGRFTATMEVVAFEKQGEAPYVWLMQITTPSKQQRRGEFRLPTRLEVNICEYKDGMETSLPVFGEANEQEIMENVNTRDISVSGVAFKSKKEYNAGEKYLLKVYIEDQQARSQPFLVCAEVMRALKLPDSRVQHIGMRYCGMTNNRSEVLSRYVFSEQQKIIRQGRRFD